MPWQRGTNVLEVLLMLLEATQCYRRLEWSLPASVCCQFQDLGQGKDKAGMEVPIPREAQGIRFSQVFPKPVLSPIPLHPYSVAEVEGLETQWHPWCDGNRQESRRVCGAQPLEAIRDSVQQQWGWAPAVLPLPSFWWVSCSNQPEDCPWDRYVHGSSSSSSSLPP